jgi:hypothetical protein
MSICPGTNSASLRAESGRVADRQGRRSGRPSIGDRRGGSHQQRNQDRQHGKDGDPRCASLRGRHTVTISTEPVRAQALPEAHGSSDSPVMLGPVNGREPDDQGDG